MVGSDKRGCGGLWEGTSCFARSAGPKLPGHSRLLVCDWSEEDVSAWLCAEGLEALVDTFKANNIDGGELVSLTKDTLVSEMKIGEGACVFASKSQGHRWNCGNFHVGGCVM